MLHYDKVKDSCHIVTQIHHLKASLSKFLNSRSFYFITNSPGESITRFSITLSFSNPETNVFKIFNCLQMISIFSTKIFSTKNLFGGWKTYILSFWRLKSSQHWQFLVSCKEAFPKLLFEIGICDFNRPNAASHICVLVSPRK